MAKVMDGINEARVQFRNFWFDEYATQELRNCLANYTQEWDEKKGAFRDNPKHDWSSHGADAFRYAVQAYKFLMGERNDYAIVEVDYSDFL